MSDVMAWRANRKRSLISDSKPAVTMGSQTSNSNWVWRLQGRLSSVDSGHVKNVWVQVACDIHRHRPFFAGPFGSRVPGCGVYWGRLVSSRKMFSSRLSEGKLVTAELISTWTLLTMVILLFYSPFNSSRKNKFARFRVSSKQILILYL